MQSNVFVLSSDGETLYTIEAILDGAALNLYCGCQAGLLGKLCKHRLALIEGDFTNVDGKTEKGDLDKISSWLRESEYPLLVHNLREAERSEKLAKLNVAAIKKKIESMMNN